MPRICSGGSAGIRLRNAGGINLYGFVGNDAIDEVDPFGLDNIYGSYTGGTWNNNVPNITLSGSVGGGPVNTQYNGGGLGDPIFLVGMMAGGPGWLVGGAVGSGAGWANALALFGAIALESYRDNNNHCSAALAGTVQSNGGNAPAHGGDVHNQMIDDYIDGLPENAVNIRKNQQQVDADGNNVGNNRPDLQYDIDGVHHNVEFDTNPDNSINHFNTINANDPASPIELFF